MSDEKEKTISITVEGMPFTFSKEITIGDELLLYGRRSALCGGQYGALSTSPEMGEQMAAITAHRIATLEAHLLTAGDDFPGFEKLKPDTIVLIWKEFAVKAGLFRPDDDKTKDSEKPPIKKSSKKDSKKKEP